MPASLTDAKRYNGLLTVEIALVDALDWVSEMHPTKSRVMRRERYRAALALLRDEIARMATLVCTCGGYDPLQDPVTGDFVVSHRADCRAWRLIDMTRATADDLQAVAARATVKP